MMKMLHSPRFWMSVLSGLGIFASGYLLYVYVTGGPIACGPAHGCDLVRASRWAYLGPIPQPLLGVVFYAGILGLLIVRSILGSSPRVALLLKRLTFLGACIGFIESVVLFLIQWVEIGAFCAWCLVSGATSTGIFMLAWLDSSTQTEEQKLAELRGYALVMGLLVVLGIPGFLYLVRPALLGL